MIFTFNPKIDDNLEIILIALIHSKLIDYKTYLPYCDNKILELNNPPEWLLDLAINSNAYNDNSHVSCYIEDKEFFHNLKFEDLILSCYYVGYEVGLWDWSHFLLQSGYYSDSYWSCKWSCEDFFYPLEDYKKYGFDTKQQLLEKKFLKDFQKEVSFIAEYYNYFKNFYDKDY